MEAQDRASGAQNPNGPTCPEFVTKSVAKSDLGTSIPPKWMTFRAGCSEIDPRGHISTFRGPIVDSQIWKISRSGPEKPLEATPQD